MPIEFDAAKRAATLRVRGLDMARAGEVFAGATLTIEDDRRDYGEDRFITVGFLDGAMVVLVWTPRDGAHLAGRDRSLQGRRSRLADADRRGASGVDREKRHCVTAARGRRITMFFYAASRAPALWPVVSG